MLDVLPHRTQDLECVRVLTPGLRGWGPESHRHGRGRAGRAWGVGWHEQRAVTEVRRLL